MSAVARNGDAMNNATLANHITIVTWIPNPTEENPSGGYNYYTTTDATVSGAISRASGNVYVNGMLACTKDDSTIENDSYSLPSNYSYVSGSHSNASGTIAGGSSSVFINGKPIARVGDSIATHSGGSSTIRDGSSNVFAN